MKKYWIGVLFTLLMVFCVGVTGFAEDAVGTFSYYDTAEFSFGSFTLPEILANHTVYGELRDKTKTSIADFSPEEFFFNVVEGKTEVYTSHPRMFDDGTYTFLITTVNNETGATTKYTIPVEYTVIRPSTSVPQAPVGQGQYRIFFNNLIISDTSTFDVSLLDSGNQMVATAYTDFTSENLVGSMITRTPSGIPGYSFIEMATLFQTESISEGDYQLFFNIDNRLVSYQETCTVQMIDAPIVQSISPVVSNDVLYGENHLHPMVSGGSGFDIIVTGFQINPQKLTAVLYNSEGTRVAKSASFSYHDTLSLGYGVINGYQKETGIQAFVLHMNVASSASLYEGEEYRISLSYEGSKLYGTKEALCIPSTGLHVISAEPYDVSSISLEVVNATPETEYDLVLFDDAYGEIAGGRILVSESGFVDVSLDNYLTKGQGVLLGTDGSYAQFFYKNDLLGLFIPQEVRANPLVLHPSTTNFVAHFEMKNYNISENASIDVQLLKFAEKINGAYIGIEKPYSVALSSGVQSVVRSKQEGYYNTDLLIEMKVNSALDEDALYSYLLTIDGHQIYLIEQGENYIVQVANNTVYYAEILDRTILGGIPVNQDEIYFWCNGVVVRDPTMLHFVLIDELGTTVADMSQASLTLLSSEAEQQYCGRLSVVSSMSVGETYYLLAYYGNELLYTSEAYFGDDGAFATVLTQVGDNFGIGERVITFFSQLTNISLDRISFEVVDLLRPFDTLSIVSTHTTYNFDSYYQWKHTLTLGESLHEGVYKIVLLVDGNPVADAMINVSAGAQISDIITDDNNGKIAGYKVELENCTEGMYSLLLGRSSAFSDAKVIESKPFSDGHIYLRYEELSGLPNGEYHVFLLQNGIPLSSYRYYHSPFSTTLAPVDGNVIDGELDEVEPVVTVVLSQPLNLNTVSPQTVQILDAEGNALRISVATSADRKTLQVYPQVALHAGAQYKLVLSTALHGMSYGRLSDTLSLPFVIRDGNQGKMDFFVSNDQNMEISTDDSFSISFLENSFDGDALLGIWTEEAQIDLSSLAGLEQIGFTLEITDYQEDARFKHSALLSFFNLSLPDGAEFVLLRFNPSVSRYELISKCDYIDGVVRVPIDSCGKYALCVSEKLPFDDVRGSWAEEYVKTLWHQKIISGYTETYFGADSCITRSEFIKMLITSLNLPLLKPEQYDLRLFRDYEEIEDWALPFWTTAYQLNIIKGTASNILSPNSHITRAELITIIGRAKSLASVDKFNFSDSTDVPVWSQDYFNAAYEAGLLSGYPDGTIRPNGLATRAETAKIIYNLLALN